MAGIASILPALLGAIGGGIGGAAPKVTDTSSSSNGMTSSGTDSSFYQQLQTLLNTLSTLNGKTSQDTSQTSNVNLSPEAQALQKQLAGQYSTLAGQAPDLSGYSAQGQEGINRNSQLQSQSVDSILAARGLSTSPAAATAQSNIDANRIGQINSFKQSIPLLSNQMQLSNLGSAASFLSSIPHGTTTTGTTTGTTEQTGSTSQTGSNISDGRQGSQGFQSSASNSTGTSRVGGGAAGGVAGGLAGLLAGLFG